MPALPSVNQSIRDPGIRSGGVPRSTPVYVGYTSGGTPNTLTWYDTPDAAVNDHEDGPALEMALCALEEAGGPVGILCADTTVAGDNSAVTKVDSHEGPTISLAGTSRYDHFFELEIVGAGALGAGKFRYNRDGFSGATDAQKSWTEYITIPSGGDYAVPNSDLTVTFAAGTYVVGDQYTWTSECPAMNASDLADAFDVLAATNRRYRFVVLAASANVGAASGHATLAAAFQSELNALANLGRNRRGMMPADAAADDAAVTTAYAAVTANRVLLLFSDVAWLSGRKLLGYVRPRGSALSSAAARAAQVRISTDLKRTESGPLPRILEVYHDEASDPTGLDDEYISTLRSWVGLGTPFFGQGRLKAAQGSDYRLWPRGTVMDAICDITFEESQKFIGMGLRFNAGPDVGDGLNAAGLTIGALDPRDIKRLETMVNTRLRAEILQDFNEEGERGHATDVRYRISPTHDVATTETIIGDVNGVPLVYPSRVDNTLGWGTST